MRRWLFLALLLLLAGPASAGSGTYSPMPGATFGEATDSNGFFLPKTTIWDSVAGGSGVGVSSANSMQTSNVPTSNAYGLSICTLNPAASTNSTNCKASAATLYHVRIMCNATATTVQYLRLYNLSSAPTCSSATGYVDTVQAPFNTGGAGVVADMTNFGVNYGTGLGFCFTGGFGNTDTTNATASACTVTLYYK